MNYKEIIEAQQKGHEAEPHMIFWNCVVVDCNGNEQMFGGETTLKGAHNVLDVVATYLKVNECTLDNLAFYVGEHGEKVDFESAEEVK